MFHSTLYNTWLYHNSINIVPLLTDGGGSILVKEYLCILGYGRLSRLSFTDQVISLEGIYGSRINILQFFRWKKNQESNVWKTYYGDNIFFLILTPKILNIRCDKRVIPDITHKFTHNVFCRVISPIFK